MRDDWTEVGETRDMGFSDLAEDCNNEVFLWDAGMDDAVWRELREVNYGK